MGISSLESKPPNPLRAGRSPPPAWEGKGAKGLGGNGAKSEPVLAAEVLTDKTLRFSSVQAKALEGHPRQFLAVLTHLLPPSLCKPAPSRVHVWIERTRTAIQWPRTHPRPREEQPRIRRAARRAQGRARCRRPLQLRLQVRERGSAAGPRHSLCRERPFPRALGLCSAVLVTSTGIRTPCHQQYLRWR